MPESDDGDAEGAGWAMNIWKEGWFSLADYYPEHGALVEVGRVDGGQLFNWGVMRLSDLHPETNSAGLIWRYTGIAKEMGFTKPIQRLQPYGSNAPFLSGLLGEHCGVNRLLGGMPE